MPPRKKPKSARQKKADVQLRRAIKRGDVTAPVLKKNAHKPGRPSGSLVPTTKVADIQSAQRLQSVFITLPPNFLQQTKLLASTLPLHRPIPNEATVLAKSHDDTNTLKLLCPRRPKWRFDMTKKEVERNEEGLFKIWLDQTDKTVETWRNAGGGQEEHETQAEEPVVQGESSVIHRSPTYFERNLEVWRQLWRVTEISQIILVLLDSRCPLLHFPPSLSGYLADRKIILVLTKVEIPGPARIDAWIEYFQKHYPGLRIVQVESYVEKLAREGHQGRKQFMPYLNPAFREGLVKAIREVHAEMIQPSAKVKNDPVLLKKWKPPVKQMINWDNVLKAEGPQVGSIVHRTAFSSTDNETAGDKEPECLTIGVVGQPNVGKSSLLNALFGTSKVRASKTPGKTKHFQTLFWTPDIRLVDCPGLVMPSFVPMEMQALCGILPVSRISAIPLCIHHASQLLPLEHVYKLTHPVSAIPSDDDKRTWRSGMKPNIAEGKTKELTWTAMDILIAYANTNKWVTAKAGRPDIHRAGNAILRALAEGKIGWASWPPGTDTKRITEDLNGEGKGLWIPRATFIDEGSEGESEENTNNEEEEDSTATNSDEPNTDSDDDREEEGAESDDSHMRNINGFRVLTIDDASGEGI